MNDLDISKILKWTIVISGSIFVWALAAQCWRQAYAAMKAGQVTPKSWLRDGSLLPACVGLILARSRLFLSLVLFYALIGYLQVYNASLEIMANASFWGRWCGCAATCLVEFMAKASLNGWAFGGVSDIMKAPKVFLLARRWSLYAAAMASLQALGFFYVSRKSFLKFDAREMLLGALIFVFSLIMAPTWLALETALAGCAAPSLALFKTSLRLGKGNVVKLWMAYLGQFALIGGLVFVSKGNAFAHGAIEAISSALMTVLGAVFGAHLWAKAGAGRPGALASADPGH